MSAPQPPEVAPDDPGLPNVAPDTVSPHQVAAMARILGLNPDNVVAIHAQLTRVDVVLFDPPEPGGAPRLPLLRQVTYLVDR